MTRLLRWLAVLSRLLRPRWDRFAAATFGFAYFLALTSPRVLDPRDATIVGGADPSYHSLARDFAQWDEWHWPFTRLDNYLMPLGTTVVYTDSNPWIVLLTKLLLPRDSPSLQFEGPWLALMFALMGWFGARLAARGTDDLTTRAIGGALFAMAPPLQHRLMHSALCAHFVLLVILEAALVPRDDARGGTKALARLAAVMAFTAGLHPGLFFIALPIAVVATLRHVERTTKSAVYLAGVALAPALVFWAFGTFRSRDEIEAFGFGFYSTNLLSLVDPLDEPRSLFLPALPHGPGQYEGVAYLGAGVLALVVFALGVLSRKRPTLDRWTWALIVVLALGFVFALSSRVMFGDVLVVDLTKLYDHFKAVTGAFRSSGRFIWPLHYALIAFGVIVAARLPQRRIVLALALLVQLVDQHHADGRGFFALGDRPAAPSAMWHLAKGEYKTLFVDPPDLMLQGPRCDERTGQEVLVTLGRVASNERLVFNSGHTSRANSAAVKAICQDVRVSRAQGIFDDQTIYTPEVNVAAAYVSSPHLKCGVIGDRHVCVRKDRPTRLLRLLDEEAPPALAIGSDPRVTLIGFGSPQPEQWAGARGEIILQPTGGKTSYLGVVMKLARDRIENRTPILRVFVDGKGAKTLRVHQETVSFDLPLATGDAPTKVVFRIDGHRRDEDANASIRVFALTRLEWFNAD